MLIREANQNDVAVILDIELSAASPWSKSLIAAELNHRSGVSLVIVNTQSNTIIGWCCVRFLPPEAELLKITIHQENRRSGSGTYLLLDLIEKCKKAGCRELFLEVRERNTPARQFYRKLGFKNHGVRHAYYHDPLDNCLILKKILFTQANISRGD